MAVNFNQTSDLMLLELLNQAQPVVEPPKPPLTFDLIEFGSPSVSLNPPRNTVVSVAPKPPNVVGNPISVRYPRLDMAAYFINGVEITVPDDTPYPTTTAGLLSYLNTLFGLQMRNNDIVVANIEDPSDITLEAAPGSYVWFGSAFISLKREPVDISSLISITDLGEFNI